MYITETATKKIDEEYRKRGGKFKIAGLEIHGNRVVTNGLSICEITEISRFIDELTAFRDAILDATGIQF